MSNQLTDRLHDDFQARGRACRARRREDIETHFWLMISDFGGRSLENPFQHTAQQRLEVKGLFKNFTDASKEGSIERVREEGAILYEFSKLIFEKMPFHDELDLSLQPLEDLEAINDDYLARMIKSVEPITQKRALELIEIWNRNEFFISSADNDLLEMDRAIQAKLLWNVDQVLSNQFLPNMSHLLDFLLTERGEIEFLVNGLPEHAVFVDFVKENKQQLNEGEITSIANSGEKVALRRFLEKIANHYFLDFRTEQKISGKENGHQITTLRKQELEGFYRRQKVSLPKTDKDRKIYMKREVIRKRIAGETLSRQEDAFYKTIGERVILKRRELVPTRVYTKLLENMVAPSMFVITG